eukprot:2737405-Rhodomonas_salina.1
MAVWVPVVNTKGDMEKHCVSLVYSSDINNTNPDTSAPCSIWTTSYESGDVSGDDPCDKLVLCHTADEMKQPNVLPITSDMMCHEIIGHIRKYAERTAPDYDSDGSSSLSSSENGSTSDSQRTSAEYDAEGNLTRAAYAAGGADEYDEDGNFTGTAFAGVGEDRDEYDEDGNFTGTAYAAPDTTCADSYDAEGNFTGANVGSDGTLSSDTDAQPKAVSDTSAGMQLPTEDEPVPAAAERTHSVASSSSCNSFSDGDGYGDGYGQEMGGAPTTAAAQGEEDFAQTSSEGSSDVSLDESEEGDAELNVDEEASCGEHYESASTSDQSENSESDSELSASTSASSEEELSEANTSHSE